MKSDVSGVKKELDRVATPDEIRTALAPIANNDSTETNEMPLEIRSDLGGYVRITAQEFEVMSLMEDICR